MDFYQLLNSQILIFLIVFFPLLIGFIRKRRYFFTLFLSTTATTTFITQLLKKITAQPRPFSENPLILGTKTNIPQDYSFPSLHTSLGTLFAWILTFIYPKFSWLWFAILMIIAISRVKLGFHYPKDIFGGFLISTLIFWFVYLLARSKKTLAWKRDLNIRRKIIHLFYGFILVFLLDYQILTTNLFLWWLILNFFIVFISPFLPKKIKFLILLFERNYHKKHLAVGAFLFTLSAFLSWIIFPKNIALVAILNLAIGDSVNALAGSFLKSRGKKRIEAALASFFATLLISAQYLVIPAALAGSLATFVLEYTEPKWQGKKIDDNLLIPILSGSVIFFVSHLRIPY